MGKAIDLKGADASSSAPKPEDKQKDQEEQPPSVSSQLSSKVALLESAVRSKETRVLAGRLIRQTTALRKRLDAESLCEFLKTVFPEGHPEASILLSHVNKVL
jgi:26S proteasome regulatory subunit N3